MKKPPIDSQHEKKAKPPLSCDIITKNLNLKNKITSKRKQLVIGLTGGIATGKSSVGKFLQKHYSIPILDADLICHELLKSNSPYTQTIIKRYGKKIARPNKSNSISINRSKLAGIIFNDPSERNWIEELLHPLVRERINDQVNQMENLPIVILIIPLLFESNMIDICNQTWVVYCNREEQLKRLIIRDNLSQEDALKRINSQWPIDMKRKLADVVINNNGKVEELIPKLKKICSKYLLI